MQQIIGQNSTKNIVAFGGLMLLLHTGLNFLFSINTPIVAIALVHLFFTFLLWSAWAYTVRTKKREFDRIWVAYILIVTIKFFIFLAFAYWFKHYFNIPKKTAPFTLFLWLFIYLYYEVKIIQKEIKNS